MHKIVLLPLDERPCNYKFPPALFESDSMHICLPDRLGDKKLPADSGAVRDFLLRECADADGLVISLETLLYGGLIPSRLHFLTRRELLGRLELLRQLRQDNPDLTVYGFNCIMRCPVTSSSDEEPDYYGRYGAEIHKLGAARHRAELGEEGAQAEADALEALIPQEYIDDYLLRRDLNLELNFAVLDLVEDGTIDFLCIPQDDAAPLGFTAMDQAKVRLCVREKRLQDRVLIYPGADELGMTLLARMRNMLEKRTPSVYVLYAAEGAPLVVPPFEDRPLGETVRYQLQAAGCRVAAAPESADFILGVNAPSRNMVNAIHQPRLDPDYDVGRSLTTFMAELSYQIDLGKPVTICDNAYCNGGDLELLDMLDASGLLMAVAGYAGWNTSSNTMGTSIAQGVRYLYEGDDARHRDFLTLRYLEDCGYCSVVRWDAVKEDLPELGLDYFNAGSRDGQAARRVERRLRDFAESYLPSIAKHIELRSVTLPWRRMFEVDLDVGYVSA